MRIIPFEIYLLQTKLSEEEVKARLQENIATGNYLKRHFTGNEIYQGQIIKDYFELRMITPGRNLFKAIIGGKIFSKPAGAVVKIKLRMQETGMIFLILIALIFVLLTIIEIKDWINNSLNENNGSALIVFIVLNVVILSLYNLHTQYIKNNLKEILEAEELK